MSTGQVIFQEPISKTPPILENTYVLKEDVICEWTAHSITQDEIEKIYTIHHKDGRRKTNLVLNDFYECLVVIALDDYKYADSLDFLKVKSEKAEE